MSAGRWGLRLRLVILVCVLVGVSITCLYVALTDYAQRREERARRTSQRSPEPRAHKPQPIHHLQYQALMRYPRDYGRHDKYRLVFLAERGVPPEQRTYESCLAGSKKYLRERWRVLCQQRLALPEISDPRAMRRRWCGFAADEKRIYADGVRLGLPRDDLRGPLPEEARTKEQQLQQRLADAPREAAVEKLVLLALITPHARKALDQLAASLDEVEDERLKRDLWEDLLRDPDPRAAELLRKRCLSVSVEEPLYLLLFYREQYGSDDELERLIRRAPSDAALETALSRLRSRRSGYPFLTRVVSDTQVPLSRRKRLVRTLVHESWGRESTRYVLGLAPAPDADALKVAVLQEALTGGYRSVDEAAVRRCARSAKESMPVREAAIRYLSREVASWQSLYAMRGPGPSDANNAQNLATLKQIAESPDEDPRLGAHAANGVLEPMTEIDHLNCKLDDMVNDPRRLAAVRVLKGLDAMTLGAAEKLRIGTDARERLFSWEKQIVQHALKLIFAKVKQYADGHKGCLPGALKAVEPVPRFAKNAGLYFPVKNSEKLTRDLARLS